MKQFKHDEKVCLLYIILTYFLYLGCMSFAMVNYDSEPIKKDFVLRRGRLRNALRNSRRNGRTRFLAFK